MVEDDKEPGPGSASERAAAAARQSLSEERFPAPAAEVAATEDAEPTEPKQDTGPSPEPASPATEKPAAAEPGDKPDESELPEGEEVEPAAAAPPEPSQTQSDEDDAEKVWSQYKDEAERKKALAETKRYAAKMAAENKAKTAELEALKKGAAPPEPGAEATPPATEEPPDPTAPPKPDEVEAAIRKLEESNPDFAEAVAVLGQQLEIVSGWKERRDTLKKSVDTLTDELSDINRDIARQEKRLAADPENFDIQETVKALQAERTQKRTDLNDARLNHQDATVSHREADQAYHRNLDKIRTFASQTLTQGREKVHTDARNERSKIATRKAWEASFPKVADHFKIPEALRKGANEMLLARALATWPDGDDETTQFPIDQIEAWMLTQGKSVREFIDQIEQAARKDYAEKKRKDAGIQKAPPPERAVAAERPRAPTSSEEAAAVARRGFAEEMRRSRSRPSA